jgi:lipopolysaccharide/colanic/teichoic acid biosynthesis glycosyltransferase
MNRPKRVLDLVLILAFGPLIVPVLLVVALAILLVDGRPLFYTSKRLGLGSEPFAFHKFRSMVVDADRLRSAEANEADGPLYKVALDPRVTPLGALLRKYSLDELPQVLNVLRGDMHFVGPRPLPEEDIARHIEEHGEHAPWAEARALVKPGITGLWQVMGRSDLPFERMVEFDMLYLEQWSPMRDVAILIRTIPAVLMGRGAR